MLESAKQMFHFQDSWFYLIAHAFLCNVLVVKQ